MSLRSSDWLRAASLLGLAALLSACCAYERRAPKVAPAPADEAMETMETIEEMESPDVENAARGQMQHWTRDNQWNRHQYR